MKSLIQKIFPLFLSILILFLGIYLENKYKLVSNISRVESKAERVTRVVRYNKKKQFKQFLGRFDENLVGGFESEDDLNFWEAGSVSIALSKAFASQGNASLRVEFLSGGSSVLKSIPLSKFADWSNYKYLRTDIYDPNGETTLYFIAQNSPSSKQAFKLEPGWNQIYVDISLLESKLISQFAFSVQDKDTETVVYLDNIHFITIEQAKENPKDPEVVIDAKEKIRDINPFIFGTNLEPETTDQIAVRTFAKDTGITIFRFPGGDAPGYHWETTTFDFRTDRPHMFPMAKYDNVVDYCKVVGAQLVIQINLESGTPEEAAEWVRYTNKELGFYVKYWELGNEPYGDWDKSHRTAEEYAEDLKVYSEAMKAVDPTIKLGAAYSGDYFKYWDKTVLSKAGEYIDFVSYHWYPNHTNDNHKVKGKKHPEPLDVAANAFKVPEITQRMREKIKKYAPERVGKIEFSVLEWDGAWDGPSYDPAPYEEGVMAWSLSNALFYAEVFGQFIKEGVTLAASYKFQETPFGYIRGYFTENEGLNVLWDNQTIRPKALAHKMFSKYFGDVLIEGDLKGSSFFEKEPDWYDASYAGEVPYLSSYASLTKEEDRLYLILVNRHSSQEFPITVSIKNFEFNPEVTVRILTGPEITSQNDGSPGTVTIKESTMNLPSNKFIYTVPAHAVISIELNKKQVEE